MSALKRVRCWLLLLATTAMVLPASAEAQLGSRLRDAARNAAEREAARQVAKAVTNAMRCALGDSACVERAEREGRTVTYTDDSGRLITDEDGNPVTDPDEAARAGTVRPGEGVWANWDFVPGDDVIFVDDYSADRVGDFPRRWGLVAGSFETVEWEGGRYVRVISNGTAVLPLPRTLPERFTVEFAINITHGNQYVSLTSAPYGHGPRRNEFEGSRIAWGNARAGIEPTRDAGPEVRTPIETGRYATDVVPVRVMADGEHMKVYWDDRRIANVPNAVFPRTDSLYLTFTSVSGENPILVGPIRIAGGGLELYDRLARDGRVATQGILFATGSDRLRPESTPVLEEIVLMLEQHPDLRLRVEGHTDDVGDDASNQELSERRAASVKAWLVESGGVAAERLETVGLGESKPAAEGTSPEARAQNRRVELVDLRGGG